jgi:hypothetical protein
MTLHEHTITGEIPAWLAVRLALLAHAIGAMVQSGRGRILSTHSCHFAAEHGKTYDMKSF